MPAGGVSGRGAAAGGHPDARRDRALRRPRPAGPSGLDGPGRGALGADRRQRQRQEHAAEPDLRRQPQGVRLRHRTLRPAPRVRRNDLGHQEEHRLRQPGAAPRLPGGCARAGHRHERALRHRGALPAPFAGAICLCAALDGGVRHRGARPAAFPAPLQRRAAALPRGARLRQGSAALHPRRAAARP